MLKTVNPTLNWPIIGHQPAVNFLQKTLENQKLNHAYLFSGPPLVGKSTVAKYFIQSLLCDNLAAGKLVPCNNCQGCRQINLKIHPDVFEVNLEHNEKTGKLNKNISLEQIKELQSKLSRCSFLNSYKVAIIYETEKLSEKGINALLKTLEEPTPKTILILLVNDLESLPPTIISRCQVIKFLPVKSLEIVNYLLKQGASKKQAEQLSLLSNGCPGTAINFYENENLFIAHQELSEEFINLTYQPIGERFKLVSSLIFKFDDLSELIDYLTKVLAVWQGLIRDSLLIKNSCGYLIWNSFLRSKLEKFAANYSTQKLSELIKNINQTNLYLQANVNPRLAMENLVLSI